MKVLIVHNYYAQYGGEDRVVDSQQALLRENGFEVVVFFRRNDAIRGLFGSFKALLAMFLPLRTLLEIGVLVLRERPDVAHVHNTFPLISPLVLPLLRVLGIPVAVTLHNYRAICPTAMLFYDEQVCDRSVAVGAMWAFGRRIYRRSRLQTAALVLLIEIHKIFGTWWRCANRVLVLSEHAKEIFVRSGFVRGKITVMPNFSVGPVENIRGHVGRGALYVGRLSPEKGVELLVQSWSGLQYPLYIVGDGPLQDQLKEKATENISFLGRLNEADVREKMREALFLVVPSLWYEMFPMTLLEAYSEGLPTLASNIGSLREIIHDHETGCLFDVGNASSLAQKAEMMIANPLFCEKLGLAARREWEEIYSPEAGCRHLREIYSTMTQKNTGRA